MSARRIKVPSRGGDFPDNGSDYAKEHPVTDVTDAIARAYCDGFMAGQQSVYDEAQAILKTAKPDPTHDTEFRPNLPREKLFP